MPINARNIIIKAHQKPIISVAAPSVDGRPSTLDSIKKEAKEKLAKKKLVEEIVEAKEKLVEKIVEVVAPEEQKYRHKEDGELIRRINTKSHYLRDMIEDF